jgi:hypothetical protein
MGGGGFEQDSKMFRTDRIRESLNLNRIQRCSGQTGFASNQ